MFYEAELVSDSFEDDPKKMGHIKVRFRRKVRWARPMFQFSEFAIPTKKWIQKYAANNAIGVYVTFVNNEERLLWAGFTIYQDQLPEEAKTNYSFRRVRFLENWVIYTDDKDGENKYVIEHNDGTKFIIDRTSGEEKVEITDGVNDHSLVMDSGGLKYDGEPVVLKPFLDYLSQNKTQIGLGNQGSPVPLHPNHITDFEDGILATGDFTSEEPG